MHGPPDCGLGQVLGPVHQAVGEMPFVPLVACHPERLHQSQLLWSLGLALWTLLMGRSALPREVRKLVKETQPWPREAPIGGGTDLSLTKRPLSCTVSGPVAWPGEPPV